MSLAEYFIGAGDIHVAELSNTGVPGSFRNVGEAPVFEWNPSVDYADNFKTGKTGPNLQDLHTVIKRTASLNLTLKERTAANLELFLHGDKTTEIAGSMATPYTYGTVAVGDVLLIPGDHMGITSLVMKDSTGSPVTLTLDTHYSYDGNAKLITVLSLAGLTQPLKIFSYSYVASSKNTILASTPPDLCVIFDGINLAVPGERIWARIDRVAFGPASKVSLKSGSASGTATEPDAYELSGVALLAVGNDQDDGYGDMKVY